MADQTEFSFELPPDVKAGTYANMLNVWHSAYEFTLDFAVTEPVQVEDRADGTRVARVQCPVVARVRLPPTQVFAVIKALNENLTRYEQTYGQITEPGQPSG